jgi:hypothetical protein
LQGALDDLDGAHHAGAKSARLSENDLHQLTSRLDAGLRRCAAIVTGRSAVFHIQYFGHNTVTIKLAMMP